MDTRARGDIAEAAVLRTLTEAGVVAALPFGRFGPWDLVAEMSPGDFVRIQVKSGRVRGGCVEFNCCGTDHGRGPSRYEHRADVFAVHVHATGEQYVVPVAEALGSKLYLRLEPTLNNQRSGIRWAADYRMDEWLLRARERAVRSA